MGNPQTSRAINDENTRTSYKMFLDDPTRFRKYNRYIRREDPELAKSISRHVKDTKADLIKWVEDNVGFVPDTDDRTFTKVKILDVAIVAGGITRHGAEDMILKFDAGKMDDIPNTVFDSYNLRSISSQRNVRMEASPDDRIDKHVAHYIGLDVGLTLNNALPPEQRVDSGKLRNALNIRKNMDLAPRDENLKLHKKVDSRLINFDDHGMLSDEEYERLMQIVKHARSDEFQQAMINVNNGCFVYLALRDRISSFDTGNRQRLWNARTDPSKLKRKSKSSRSPE